MQKSPGWRGDDRFDPASTALGSDWNELMTRRVLARLVDAALVAFALVPLWAVLGALLREQASAGAVMVLPRSAWSLITGGPHAAADVLRTGLLEYGRPVMTVAVTLLVLQVLAAVAYDWVSHGVAGRSLGKALLGLKVVPLDPQRPAPAASSGPGIGAAATRSGVLVLLLGAAVATLAAAMALLSDLLVLAAVSVGLWWSARSGHLPELARRRGSWLNLHDRIAGTLVVHEPQGGSPLPVTWRWGWGSRKSVVRALDEGVVRTDRRTISVLRPGALRQAVAEHLPARWWAP